MCSERRGNWRRISRFHDDQCSAACSSERLKAIAEHAESFGAHVYANNQRRPVLHLNGTLHMHLTHWATGTDHHHATPSAELGAVARLTVGAANVVAVRAKDRNVVVVHAPCVNRNVQRAGWAANEIERPTEGDGGEERCNARWFAHANADHIIEASAMCLHECGDLVRCRCWRNEDLALLMK